MWLFSARYPPMKTIACASLLALGFLLAGCGQKGPLFLPGNPSEIRSEVPQVPDEDERDDEERAAGRDAEQP